MERIGIAASKMSKGNLFLYNFYVVLISILFSLFIFIVAGSTVLFALVIISHVSAEMKITEFQKTWPSILYVCMVILTIITGIMNILAIIRNIKFPKVSK